MLLSKCFQSRSFENSKSRIFEERKRFAVIYVKQKKKKNLSIVRCELEILIKKKMICYYRFLMDDGIFCLLFPFIRTVFRKKNSWKLILFVEVDF